MNILPKKRWHVRTKDNIARVRRDEKEAQAKEQERLEKLKIAESEARINFLRRQSGKPERESKQSHPKEESTTAASQHTDLFADFKTHIKTTNKDFEKEQKEEREKYEKQIGYLQYLGQDTNEALKLRSWYEVAPKRSKQSSDDIRDIEKDLKNKYTNDPLTLINKLLPGEKKLKETSTSKNNTNENVAISYTESHSLSKEQGEIKTIHKTKKDKKRKKEKKSNKNKRRKRDKKDKKSYKQKDDRKNIGIKKKQQKQELLENLRKERLKREAAERSRQNKLLCPQELVASEETKKQNALPRIVQRYNSQFNPELAKQNML